MDVLTLLGVALVGGAALTLWWGTRRARPSEMNTAWAVLTFWMAARALESPDRSVAFYRLFLWACALLVYALAGRWPVLTTRIMPTLAVIVAAYAVVEWLTAGSIAAISDYNTTADLLLLLLPWGPNGPLWWGFAAALLIVTGSRGALLGLIVALIVLIWRPRWWLALLSIVGAALLLVAVRPATALIRVDFWLDAARQIWQRPFTGWGIGAKVAGIQPHAHNIVLDAMLNGGAILALAWMWLLYVIYKLIMGPPGSRARLGLLAVLLHGVVDCTLWSPVIVIAALNVALLARYRNAVVVSGGDGAPAAAVVAG